MITAGEFCNRDVVIATPNERVVELAQRMRDHHVGSIVVVEARGLERVPIGVVTDRDIVVGLVAVEPSYLERALVGDVLGRKLVSIGEEADLYEVMARMRIHGIRRIPVVDQAGVLQGIIAFDDLLEHIALQLHRLSSLLERESDVERKQRPSVAEGPEVSPRLRARG
jgi:CBS domain-containing protein